MFPVSNVYQRQHRHCKRVIFDRRNFSFFLRGSLFELKQTRCDNFLWLDATLVSFISSAKNFIKATYLHIFKTWNTFFSQ
jgi:hypothetical protein